VSSSFIYIFLKNKNYLLMMFKWVLASGRYKQLIGYTLKDEFLIIINDLSL